MDFNNLNLTKLKKCLRNIEVVRNICKFRNYKEQCRMSQASPSLQFVIENFIWKSKFRTVEIKIYNGSDFIVTNIIDEPKFTSTAFHYLATSAIHLNVEDMNIFLTLNQNNIQKLNVETKSFQYARFPLIYDLKNLISLCFSYIAITKQELKNIVDNCKNIKSLTLFECYYDNKESLQIIKTMRSLKSLTLIRYPLNDDYCDIMLISDIVNELNLQQLVVECSLFENNDVEQYQLNAHKLKAFNDFRTRHLSNFLNIQNSFSTNFENLNTLLLIDEDVGNALFNLLLNSCRNLRQLGLVECNLLSFTALPKLQIMFVDNCFGFTYRNLKTILNEMNLKKFTSVQTTFNGDFETFTISPRLQKFTMEGGLSAENFRTLFNYNCSTKLMKLRYFCLIDINRERGEIDLQFAPNLQELYIQLPRENIKDIFELKYLEKLVVISCNSNQLMALKHLLKHENLIELSIAEYEPLPNSLENLRNIDAVKTNLHYLNIPGRMMNTEADFVLDLLNENTNLSLKCNHALLSEINRILFNNKFPKRFKSINISGFLMDCTSVRDDFLGSMEFLKFLNNDYYYILE